MEDGLPEDVGGSFNSNIQFNIGGDQSNNFLQSFKQHLETLRSQDEWPKIVIVNGDLVERGDSVEQFKKARSFLMQLANVLNINSQSIYVVPGNNDVNWSYDRSDLQPSRFKNFELGTFPITKKPLH